MMKDFFKKINRSQNDVEDLDTGYDSEYYRGAYDQNSARRPEDGYDDRRQDDRRDDRRDDRYDNRYDDRRQDDRYDNRYDDRRQDDRRQDDRRDDRRQDDRWDAPRNDGYYAPRGGWREEDAPSYRERTETTETVFEPTPAPEYLYFTPATYRDCREGIVKGLASGHVVIVRLGDLEADEVLRLFDYMMGAVLALEAELARPRATTVVLLPKGIELDEDAIEFDEEDEYDDDGDGDSDDDEYDDEEDSEYDYDEEYEDEDSEYEDGYDEEESDEDAE